MKNNAVMVDVFDLMMTEENEELASSGSKSCDDALINCLDKFGEVDMTYISDETGMSIDEVASELDGAVFQNPEVLDCKHFYDNSIGWVVSANYLSGNVGKKLEKAREANKRFPGKFESNIKALKKVTPSYVDIDDIHLSLGATWIPAEEYKRFIMDFLNLKEEIKVTFYKDLLKWKITGTSEATNSVKNIITYGVRADRIDNSTKQYLTALEIIEQTMNAKTIKVFDYVPIGYYSSSYFDYEPILNKNKTTEAQERQKEILEGFKDWVYQDRSRIVRFENYYNDAFVGYACSHYNGDFLKFPDLNPEIEFYKHQRDAIARILLSRGNILLAHDVGTGKTYEMIAAVREMHRLGLSCKNLIVVPNNVLKATVDAHKKLYENDKILAVYPKDFAPNKRNEVLANIKNGNYVAVYMAYSSFDMIVMSKDYYVEKKRKEIFDLKAATYNTNDKKEKRALESEIEKRTKAFHKYVSETKECPWMTFDELGINTLVVDEAHNYKNIPIKSRASGIVGMNGVGSKKCREMLEKAHFVDQLIFATGTPLTNSLADLYTFQVYLQPEVLKYHNINTFDTWINTFGERESTVECDVDANSDSLRVMTRFSSFNNLGELMAVFSQVCDFHHMDENDKELPMFEGHIDNKVPKNEAQAAYISNLSERTDLIRNKQVKRTEDNLLKITTDGRKAALDVRLVDKDAYVFCEDEDNKVTVCARQIMQLYNATDGVQIVFSDIGVPKDEFNIYDELKKELITIGIPSEEIAFVHDATTEAARAKLFDEMNSGNLRVVIGSTQKLGVGVNVQEKLVALHHLSVPWKPADMVQREGRILRKGNTSKQVYIFRYITRGSFDAYSWQILENKQRFIASFLSGTSGAREVSDISDTVLTYAEVKALAIGNPLIKKRVEVANKLDRTKIASRGRQKQMQELKTVIETTPHKVANLRRLSTIAMTDYNEYIKNKEVVPNDERLAFGEELLDALKANTLTGKEQVFDVYQGFRVVLPGDMYLDKRYVYIESNNGGKYRCDLNEDKTFMGCSRTIDYLLDGLKKRSEKLDVSTNLEQKKIDEAKLELEKDNPYVMEVEALKSLLAEIDKTLEEAAKKSESK